MPNKGNTKIKIDKSFFLKVIHEKSYTIESLGTHPDIDRCSKTIQRYLSANEMPIDLLDKICKVINVDPEYISGKYEKLLADSSHIS